MKPVWIKAFQDQDPFEKTDYLIFALLFFSLPFFIYTGAEDSYILPKWTLLKIGAAFLLFFQLVKGIWNKNFRIPLHPVNIAWVLFFLWQLVGVTYAESKVLAWEQIGQTLTVLILLFVFQSITFLDRRRLLALAVLLSLSGTLISIWTLAVDFLRVYTTYGDGVIDRLGDWRGIISTAGFGNTGHIADYIVLSFLVSLAGFFVVQGRKRIIFMGVLLIIQSAALIVCWSVHSNLSLIIASIFLAVMLIGRWRYETKWRQRLRRLPPLIIAWVFVLAFFAIDQPLNPHHSKHWKTPQNVQQVPVEFGIFGEAFSSQRWKEGGLTRQVIWLTSWEVITENIIFGAGTGNFTYAYPTVDSEPVLNDPDMRRFAYGWTNAAHNSVLQNWSENGIPGAVLVIAIVLSSFIFAWRRLEQESISNHLVLTTGMAMLIAMSLQSQMNFLLELPVSFFMFGLVSSIPAVVPERSGYANLDMPVSRVYGPVELGALLRNMRYPVSMTLRMKVTSRLRIFVALPFLLLTIWISYLCIKPLQASRAYRDVYEAYRQVSPFLVSNVPGVESQSEDAILQADKVLALDPNHREALSKRIEFALYVDKYKNEEEIKPYIDRLAQQLSDFKVPLYRARYLMEVQNKPEESLPYWREVHKKAPQWMLEYPEAQKLLEMYEEN